LGGLAAGAPGSRRNNIMNKRALQHVSKEGQARMVNVAAKAVTTRTARAEAWVAVGEDIAALLRQSGGVAKGNVLETARLAGIMAAKRQELIPMCHPLILDAVEVDATLVDDRVRLEAG
jgi:cyclic pyranopterin phosphate synthase